MTQAGSAELAARTACDEEPPLLAEVRLAVARAAAVWRECGVEPGETVAIALVDGGECIVACLGAAAVGAVPIAVDPLLPSDELQRLWAQGGWRFILAESREHQPADLRDFVLTGAEWREALRSSNTVGAGAHPVDA